MKTLKTSIFSISAVGILLLGYALFTPQEEPVPVEAGGEAVSATVQKVRVTTVSNTTVEQTEAVNGRVHAKYTTPLYAEVQGTIQPATFDFREGEAFSKAQTLFSINSEEQQFALAAQKKELLSQITRLLADLEADYPETYSDWEDYATRFNAEQPITALPEPRSEKERRFLNSRGIFAQYYQIRAQEQRLAKYTISAPYDGIVTEDVTEIGTLVNPGQYLGTIINNKQYELEAGIDVEWANRLSIGDQVTFSSNDVSGTWNGTISRIGAVIDPQTQHVSVFFDLSGDNLRDGLYLEGALVIDELQQVAKLPRQALQRDKTVLVLREDRVVQQPVQTLGFASDSVIVRGLYNGERVVLNAPEEPIIGKKAEALN
ncbi:MAG: HlyD family efflux transporter periplasmic adaptor subunit [Bacteroidota bacterium]